MWLRSYYESVMTLIPNCLKKPVRPEWCHFGPQKRPSMLCSWPLTWFPDLCAWAKRGLCFEPEECTSFRTTALSLTAAAAAEPGAMLMLYHTGELETTVPQMEWGSAGDWSIPQMTFSCLNVSLKTRLFYFWTQKPKTSSWEWNFATVN